MKTSARILALSALLAATPLATDARACEGMSLSLSGDHVRWAEHHDPADARLAITTEDGKVTLLLTDREVAFQLSERMVHRVRRQLRDKEDEQENPIGMAIASAVMGTVHELIDNSFECRLSQIRDVSYRGGRLVFIGKNGKRIFEGTEVDENDVMASFSERDARHFVREFRRAKAGG